MIVYIGIVPLTYNLELLIDVYTDLAKTGVAGTTIPIASVDGLGLELLEECKAAKHTPQGFVADEQIFDLDECRVDMSKYSTYVHLIESLGMKPIAILPSFLDMASQILLNDRKLVEIPNKTSILIPFLKNVIEELFNIGIDMVVIRDNTISKVFISDTWKARYGYTRDFIAEAYEYIASNAKKLAIYIPKPNTYSIEILTRVSTLKLIGLRTSDESSLYSLLSDYLVSRLVKDGRMVLLGIAVLGKSQEESSIRRVYIKALRVIPRSKLITVIDGIDMSGTESNYFISSLLKTVRVVSSLEK